MDHPDHHLSTFSSIKEYLAHQDEQNAVMRKMNYGVVVISGLAIMVGMFVLSWWHYAFWCADVHDYGTYSRSFWRAAIAPRKFLQLGFSPRVYYTLYPTSQHRHETE